MDGYCFTCGWWARLNRPTAMCAWCLDQWRTRHAQVHDPAHRAL